MSITVDANSARSFVRIRVRGKLDAEQARQALSEVIARHPGLHRLWDFRESDLTEWSSDDMRSFADFSRSAGPAAGITRVAALVSRDVDYGPSRMYEVLAASPTMQYRVFRDESEAEAWLSRDE